jgi:hypothetical protein
VKSNNWWHHDWVKHPMNDDDFKDAFFEYMLCKSDDRTLVDLRKRARFFINYICKQQIVTMLQQYREEYPLD